MLNKIEVTPFYFASPYQSGPPEGVTPVNYVDPQGLLWKVEKVEDGNVHCWNINAWGSVYTKTVNERDFLATWRVA